MSVSTRVGSDHQLARLLQIGIVLEEVVEARAERHYQSMVAEGREPDPELEALLREAAEESADHRERLEALVGALDAETIPFGEVETLVTERYARTEPEDFDGVLYDQLCNEETAYKFYDDLIEAIEASDADFSLDREHLLGALRTIREEEAAGVEEVTQLMDRENADGTGTETDAPDGEGDTPAGEAGTGGETDADGATDADANDASTRERDDEGGSGDR